MRFHTFQVDDAGISGEAYISASRHHLHRASEVVTGGNQLPCGFEGSIFRPGNCPNCGDRNSAWLFPYSGVDAVLFRQAEIDGTIRVNVE